MEVKNEIIAQMTSGILVLVFLLAISLYRIYRLEKKVKELSK